MLPTEAQIKRRLNLNKSVTKSLPFGESLLDLTLPSSNLTLPSSNLKFMRGVDHVNGIDIHVAAWCHEGPRTTEEIMMNCHSGLINFGQFFIYYIGPYVVVYSDLLVRIALRSQFTDQNTTRYMYVQMYKDGRIYMMTPTYKIVIDGDKIWNSLGQVMICYATGEIM